MTGITSDGGYAEVMIAEARALALIPDELKSEDAAPLVWAGITTFNALRNAGSAGDTVAIQGIEGLGHLGVQFARKMGFRTVAIGGGTDKEHLATKLGAHVYIDAKSGGCRRGTAKTRRRRRHPGDRAERIRDRWPASRSQWRR
jgi:propanol-preferring alcohol dehydrogenase